MRNLKRFSLISSLMVFLLAAFVLAPSPGTIITNIWAWIFGLLSGSAAASEVEVMLKIIVGILIFTILYGASIVISDFTTKNIRIALAAILSVLSIVLIPGNVLLAIAGSFSGFFGFILITLPHVPIFWFFFKTKTEERTVAGLKLALSFLGVFLSVSVNGVAGAYSGVTGSGSTIPLFGMSGVSLLGFFEYLTYVYYVIILYFIYKTIWPKAKEEEEVKEVSGKKARKKAKKLLKKFEGDKAKAQKWGLKEWYDLKALKKSVTDATDLSGLKSLKRDAARVKRDEKQANRMIFKLEQDVKKIPKGKLRDKLMKIVRDEIEVQNNIILAEMKKFDTLTSRVKSGGVAISFSDKQTQMEAIVNNMIAAESAIQASMKKLEKKANK